jgi:hypothetical protein
MARGCYAGGGTCLGAVRGNPLLLVDRDLAFRLVDTPRVCDMPCQHDA